MKRPYIVCHMTTSIDGKVTCEFLRSKSSARASEVYYEINRDYKNNGSQGFICGRVTMEESFTGGYYPDLSKYPAVTEKTDYIPDELGDYYAVAFDPKGRLGWKSNKIVDMDGDPGYDGANIVEVVTDLVEPKYLGYLKTIGVPYIFAGKEVIDVKKALNVLYEKFGMRFLLLEGGSVINGYFLNEDCVDELSLVKSRVIGGNLDKPLFSKANVTEFCLLGVRQYDDGVIWLNYKK